jgi:hypothetical protein
VMGEKEAQTNSGEYSNIVSSRRVNACTGADAERFRQRRARLRMTHHFRERFDERGFGGVRRRDLGASDRPFRPGGIIPRE